MDSHPIWARFLPSLFETRLVLVVGCAKLLYWVFKTDEYTNINMYYVYRLQGGPRPRGCKHPSTRYR